MFFINSIIITTKTIIDNNLIHNFIFQFKIKKHIFIEIDIHFQNFQNFKNIVLQIYKFYN